MKLTILGSGTNYVNKTRFPSSYLVQTQKENILLDCGSHCSLRLLDIGIRLYQIDRIIITHRHPDHMSDLVPSILSMWLGNLYYPKEKRTKPLYLHGYQGFIKDYETLRNMMFPDRPEPYKIYIQEHADDEFDIGQNLKVKTCLVPHMEQFMKAIAVRLDEKSTKKSLVYSGDTGYSTELIRLSKNANLVLYEAAFSNKSHINLGSRYGHMTPQDAATTAQEAKVKKLIITHLYEGLESKQNIYKAAKSIYDGDIVVAEDLMEFEL